MDCPHIPELGYSEFGQQLREKIGNRRVPVKGSLELTFRCNLRCVHCYVAHGHNGIPGQQELTYQEICGILDQVADEGCLWLLLTGGEPLLRPDFSDIYLYAKRKGFLVTLFTNGTLLTPRIADLLAEWPPHTVEITLYGRTQATYERITGVPGSYAKCMQGIELLLDRNVPLRLKTMLMTLNQHELWDIKTYAENLGVDFRFDPLVHASLVGDIAPMAYRLSPEKIVEFDLADTKRLKAWLEAWNYYQNRRPDPNYLYACGAGVELYHLSPYGELSMCLMARKSSYDLRRGSFHEGWHEFIPAVRYQPPTENYHCNQCRWLFLCHRCPAWAQLEHGNLEKPVDFLCQVGHLRAEAFGTLFTLLGGNDD